MLFLLLFLLSLLFSIKIKTVFLLVKENENRPRAPLKFLIASISCHISSHESITSVLVAAYSAIFQRLYTKYCRNLEYSNLSKKQDTFVIHMLVFNCMLLAPSRKGGGESVSETGRKSESNVFIFLSYNFSLNEKYTFACSH